MSEGREGQSQGIQRLHSKSSSKAVTIIGLAAMHAAVSAHPESRPPELCGSHEDVYNGRQRHVELEVQVVLTNLPTTPSQLAGVKEQANCRYAASA